MSNSSEATSDDWALSGSRTGEIVVIARWRPTTEGRDVVLSTLPALVAASQAEPGCLGYQALTSADGDIVLVERYVDQAAVETHRASEHFQQLALGTIVPHLQTRDVTVCTVN